MDQGNSGGTGMTVPDIERILQKVLDEHGAVSERLLIVKLDSLLHQFTDHDPWLDANEERGILDQVLCPGHGKSMGLNPCVARDYVDGFCKTNRIRRDGVRSWKTYIAIASLIALILVGIGGMYFFSIDS